MVRVQARTCSATLMRPSSAPMSQNSLFDASAELPAPTRAAGLARLRAFTPAMGRRYAASRNHDFGPQDRSNVSALSAHVRRRLVTEAELASAALDAHGLEAAEKFIQEVCWRTYWKGWLEQRPSVWRSYRAGVERDLAALEKDGGLRARYEAAVDGRTGIECFDVWARELVETGYLHNHARMWFASIWIYTLDLPWRLGADVFLRHLIDGDAASNTLSWRWVCGLHTAGKTYLARATNIIKFSGGRFEMQGYDLASEAPPLGEPDHPAPVMPPPGERPEPGAPAIVLIHDEDGLAEDWPLDGVEVRGVVSLHALDAVSPLPPGDAARAFTETALTDAAARAGAHFGVQPAALEGADALIEAAREAGAVQILTMRPHVGPLADTLDAKTRDLAAAGVRLVSLQRDWDAVFHPHADRGFFKLKKAIPKALGRLGLA
jgi:deoxyribodipyrimidine photo-lyase